jgi:hypothetical protein
MPARGKAAETVVHDLDLRPAERREAVARLTPSRSPVRTREGTLDAGILAQLSSDLASPTPTSVAVQHAECPPLNRSGSARLQNQNGAVEASIVPNRAHSAAANLSSTKRSSMAREGVLKRGIARWCRREAVRRDLDDAGEGTLQTPCELVMRRHRAVATSPCRHDSCAYARNRRRARPCFPLLRDHVGHSRRRAAASPPVGRGLRR